MLERRPELPQPPVNRRTLSLLTVGASVVVVVIDVEVVLVAVVVVVVVVVVALVVEPGKN